MLTNEEIKQIKCENCGKKKIRKQQSFWVCKSCGYVYEEWELPDLMEK